MKYGTRPGSPIAHVGESERRTGAAARSDSGQATTRIEQGDQSSLSLRSPTVALQGLSGAPASVAR